MSIILYLFYSGSMDTRCTYNQKINNNFPINKTKKQL